jgi:hypothetical protein
MSDEELLSLAETVELDELTAEVVSRLATATDQVAAFVNAVAELERTCNEAGFVPDATRRQR